MIESSSPMAAMKVRSCMIQGLKDGEERSAMRVRVAVDPTRVCASFLVRFVTYSLRHGSIREIGFSASV